MDKYTLKFIKLIESISQIKDERQRLDGLKNIINQIYEDGFEDGANQ